MVTLTTYCFEPNALFDRRNHEYGAYPLRYYYRRRVLISLVIGVVMFTAAALAPNRLNRESDASIEAIFNGGNVLRDLDPQPEQPVEIPEERPLPKQKSNLVRFVAPEPVPDAEAEEEAPPTQDTLRMVQAATISQVGDPDANANEIIPEDDPGPDVVAVVGTTVAPKEEAMDFLVVEQRPEFPGGKDAMGRFLGRELRYPDMALRSGLEGRVGVSFIVDREGNITDIEVTRPLGGGCDEEAVRVVKAMPRWIPGRQRGVAVPVKYATSFRFVLN